MICVCYIGDDSSTVFRDNLLARLGENFHVFYADKKLSYEKGKGNSILVLNAKITKELLINSCILVFAENAKITVPKIVCENITAIVNSTSTAQIKALAKLGIPVITCGNSQKDTLTYSSVTDDGIVVSLQRSIKSLLGNTIEPLELPITNSDNLDIYSGLASVGIYLTSETN